MSKIIIAGDSIAYGKWDSEGGWVARLRKYIDKNYNFGKGSNFQVYNLGIPGETALRLAQRFENELTVRLPLQENTNGSNVVLFAIGINDSCSNNWMTQEKTPEGEFKNAFKKMIDVAINHGCKVAVIGLTPVNPSRSKGLLFSDAEVLEYDSYISEVCKEKNLPKLTLFHELKTTDFEELLIDVVHPNDAGHTILATKVIEFLENENLFTYLTKANN